MRYRASKFVRRHKAAVAAAALVAASLLAALVVTLREARIAERRSQETRRLANALMFDAYDAIKELPGTTSARAIMVRTALEYLNRLAAQPNQDALQRLELSTAYVKLGDAQGMPEFSNLGDVRGALESYRKALSIRQQLAAEAPADAKAAQQVATVHNRIGRLLRVTGDVARALEHHRQALRIAEDTLAALPDDATRRRFVTGHWELCNTYVLMGDAPSALREARAGLEVAGRLLAHNPGDDDARNVYAAPLECEGDALALQGNALAALGPLTESLKTSQDLSSRDTPDGQSMLDAASLHVKVAAALAALGRTSEARAHVDVAVKTTQRLVGIDPQDIEARVEEATARAASADLTAPTQPRLAVAEYAEALRVLRRVAGIDSLNLRLREQLCTLLLHQGRAQQAAGMDSAARQSLDEAAVMARELRRKAPDVHRHQVLYDEVLRQQASPSPSASRPQEAAGGHGP